MRNLLFLILYIVGAVKSFKRPFYALIFYYWISLMNPHRYAWGSIQNLPYSKIAAFAVLISIFYRNHEIRIPKSAGFYLLIGFWGIMIVSTIFAYYPEEAIPALQETSKVLLMAIMAMLILNSEQKVIYFLAAIVIFVGFIGIKGAIFSILTGGAHRVYGPQFSSLADNNDAGLAMVMIIPIAFAIAKIFKNRMLKVIFIFIGSASIISTIFTYSRGAFLGLLTIGLVFILLGRNKAILIFLFMIIATSIFFLAPTKYKDRLLTIKTYKYDRSAQQRLNSWAFSYNLAKKNIWGGGFGCYTKELYWKYSPNPDLGHGDKAAFTAHSIYFQTMAEHGFPGVSVFVIMLIYNIINLYRIKAISEKIGKHLRLTQISKALLISTAGYMISGAFLSRAYFEVFWALYAASVCLKDILLNSIIQTLSLRDTDKQLVAMKL